MLLRVSGIRAHRSAASNEHRAAPHEHALCGCVSRNGRSVILSEVPLAGAACATATKALRPHPCRGVSRRFWFERRAGRAAMTCQRHGLVAVPWACPASPARNAPPSACMHLMCALRLTRWGQALEPPMPMLARVAARHCLCAHRSALDPPVPYRIWPNPACGALAQGLRNGMGVSSCRAKFDRTAQP